MNLHELTLPPKDQETSETGPDIELTTFNKNNVSPAMDTLLRQLSMAENINQIRQILAIYMPELEDGTTE